MRPTRQLRNTWPIAFSPTGEPVLRLAAVQLTREEILSPATQTLIASMFAAMRDAPGVGLAAPQIGVPLQIAVIEDKTEYLEKVPAAYLAERRRAPVAPHALINPRLAIMGEETAEFFEGCLSLPGFTAMVERALRVRVECLNEHAEPVTIEAEGWYARILQHEIDHLHGTLYIDRMRTRSFMTRESFERLWKDTPAGEFLKAIGDG